MNDGNAGSPDRSIPEETMRARLAQSEQLREFFCQMWLQNPLLAKHLSPRIRNLLSPLPETRDLPGG